MSKTCRVFVNGEEFSANRGDLLLDAALMNGVEIPHDCRSGHCGTCRVRVVEGRVFGGQTAGDSKTAHACQCRVISDLVLAVEEVPEVETVSGRIAELTPLAPDVIEVCMELTRPLLYYPGQYCKVQFRGFPSRCYSPTIPLDGPADDRFMHLHVRRVPNGRVSSALGEEIVEGHRVKLVGPLGSAYLRPNHRHRTILVASGTGFAPIWAIADAAMWERPDRELVLIVGARTLDSLYMIPALCRLARCRNVSIVPVVSEPQGVSQAVRTGRPTDHMPKLTARDVVYTCGAPPMVEAVARMAQAAGATCYSDPFVSDANGTDEDGVLSRALAWISGDVRPEIPSKAKRPQRTRPGYGRTGAASGAGRPRYATPRASYGSTPFGAPRRYATES